MIGTGVQTSCELLEVRFIDLLGHVKAMAIPLSRPTADLTEVALDPAVKNGITVDGSSVPGYMQVQNSDLHLAPEPDTVFRLPYDDRRAAAYCTVTKRGGGAVATDSRGRLKAMLAQYLAPTHRLEIKPELEFFLLDGNRPADNGQYLDVSPDNDLSQHLDSFFDSLTAMGVPVERVHHECAPGQVEVEIDYDSILHQADRLVSSKLALRALAKRAGLRATFMPKPMAGMAGSGMHVHFRLFDEETNLFGAPDGMLSEVGRHFVAGLLAHAAALTAVCNPSVNSYKRLVPNQEAPVYVTWGYRNRSALVRVPLAATPQKAGLEFRSPDATANVHLALAALTAAGMDGVRRASSRRRSARRTYIN